MSQAPIRSAIASTGVAKLLTSTNGTVAKRYDRNFQTGVQGVIANPRGYSFISFRAGANAGGIFGGRGSQSQPPRGPQAGFGANPQLPPGGFQNTQNASGSIPNPAAGGGSGGGQVSRATPGSDSQKGPTTTKKNNPTQQLRQAGALPPGNSPNDIFTKVLQQAILNDRKKGQEAVTTLLSVHPSFVLTTTSTIQMQFRRSSMFRAPPYPRPSLI